jgi:chromosome segregation protein
MYLADLNLHGFKSFANKTTVTFDKGITAIVGPNGCGKSNIVDALRWVLGEQKPTSLRSASMSNVIFNGTANKKALGLAEVSCTIHNNRGILPTEFNDVTITRRLYRSGESEYLLNNTPCRLKDIIELFMDTGMGSGAYSVIELKMVEEILNDKNNDRRKLFEEAAGVTKYKEKRKQTFRKLDDTKANLQRLEDILVVIRKNVRSLQLQAGRAKRAKEYSVELRKLELGLGRHEYHRIEQELGPLKDRILNAEKEKNQLKRQLSQGESSINIAKEKLIEKENELKEVSGAYNRVANEIRETETNLKITREKIVNEEQTIRQYETDIYQSERDLKDLKESIGIAEGELKKLRKDFTDVETSLKESEKSYLAYQKKAKEQQDELSEISKVHQTVNNQLNQKETQLIRLDSKYENISEERERLQKQIHKIEQELEESGETDAEKDVALEDARRNVERAEIELEEAREERDRLQQQMNEAKDAIRKLHSQRDAVESEIQLLENIAKSNEAFPSSVKFLLDEFPQFSVVSDVLSTNQEHAVALESMLGEVCNYIVTQTMDEAREGVTALKQHDKGMATFIPIQQLPAADDIQPGSFYHHVECDAKFEPLKRTLLSNVFVIDDLSEAGKSDQKNTVFVTREGDVITEDSFVRAGSKNKNTGMRVGLKDKIEKLERKAFLLEDDIDDKERELQRNQAVYEQLSIGELSERLKQVQKESAGLEKEFSTRLAQRSVMEKNIASHKDRLHNLDGLEEQIQKDIQALQPEINELKSRLNELTEQEFDKKNELEKVTDNRNRAQSRYNSIKLSYQNQEHKIDQFEREKERDQKSIEQIRERLSSRAENARMSKDRILSYREQIQDMEESIERLAEVKEKRKEELDEADLACSKERGKINQLEKDLKEIQHKREQNIELLHHLDKAKSKFDMELKNISDHIWETYNVIIDDIEQEMPEDTDVDVVKQTISSHKQKLKNIGEVNPLAIEEYEEELEKLEFYEEQITDLENAEAKLRKTIEEINETAQTRFLETFNAISRNFEDVFHTLFEENDNCQLNLIEDEEDPLNSKIEIIAQPRGKRPSHINQLSGGEKTLTAIALLFAIYLVKPSPFCILDEVDAPLDDANIERFSKVLRRFSEDTQFIVITHNKKTMEKAESMYGVTMQETGVSSLVGVEMDSLPV